MSLARRWQGHGWWQVWGQEAAYQLCWPLHRQGHLRRGGLVYPQKEILLRKARAQRASEGESDYISDSLTVTKETPGQLGLRGAVSLAVSALDSQQL